MSVCVGLCITRMEEACCHSNSSERASAKSDVKNSHGENNNNYNDRVDISFVMYKRMSAITTQNKTFTNTY